QGRLDLLAEVERRVILPLEELGCDILNVGLGLAALLEGIEMGHIPPEHVPAWMRAAASSGDLGSVAQAVELLGADEAAAYPALRAAADGPQALAERYPAMQDLVFTGGQRTLGNAGHSNALWTFLMPFSRFFGHYVGQLYKIEAELPPAGADEQAYRACFREVVRRALEREFFWLLGNALSQCAFTFVIFSRDGQGETLSEDGLLVQLLRQYGIETSPSELRWFSQAFWAQSIALKCQYGWEPPSARDMPRRIYESLAPVLERDPDELQRLMDLLIDEWKRQAGAVMRRFGYQVAW
ncbi:MAG: hypothetical protein JXA74_18305, partial [Anaerolineae bacterium]|nr:hypothetical protein [Anaerolineae bacterium]